MNGIIVEKQVKRHSASRRTKDTNTQETEHAYFGDVHSAAVVRPVRKTAETVACEHSHTPPSIFLIRHRTHHF